MFLHSKHLESIANLREVIFQLVLKVRLHVFGGTETFPLRVHSGCHLDWAVLQRLRVLVLLWLFIRAEYVCRSNVLSQRWLLDDFLYLCADGCLNLVLLWSEHDRVLSHDDGLLQFLSFEFERIVLQLKRLDPQPVLLFARVTVLEVGWYFLDVLLLWGYMRLELLDLEFKRELLVLLLFELLLQVNFIFLLFMDLRYNRVWLLFGPGHINRIDALYVHRFCGNFLTWRGMTSHSVAGFLVLGDQKLCTGHSLNFHAGLIRRNLLHWLDLLVTRCWLLHLRNCGLTLLDNFVQRSFRVFLEGAELGLGLVIAK